MRLKQSQYEKLIFFLSFLNCVKLFFYGNKIIDSISLGITAAALFFIFFNTNLIYNRRVVFLCCCVLCSLLVTIVINGGVGAFANYTILMLTSMLFVSYGISKHAMNKLFVFNGLDPFVVFIYVGCSEGKLVLFLHDNHRSEHKFKYGWNCRFVGVLFLGSTVLRN